MQWYCFSIWLLLDDWLSILLYLISLWNHMIQCYFLLYCLVLLLIVLVYIVQWNYYLTQLILNLMFFWNNTVWEGIKNTHQVQVYFVVHKVIFLPYPSNKCFCKNYLVCFGGTIWFYFTWCGVSWPDNGNHTNADKKQLDQVQPI